MRWNACLAAAAVIGISGVETIDACQKCRRNQVYCVQMVPVCRPGVSAAAAGVHAAAAKPGSGLADDINVSGTPAAAGGAAAAGIGDDINLNLGSGGVAANTTLPAWAEENWKEIAKLQSKKLGTSSEMLDLSRENLQSGYALQFVVKSEALVKKINDSWGLK